MEAQGYVEYAISKIQANQLKGNNNVNAKDEKKICLSGPEHKTPKNKREDQSGLQKTCSVYVLPGNTQKDNCMRQVSQRLWDSPLLQACFEVESASNFAVKNLVLG